MVLMFTLYLIYLLATWLKLVDAGTVSIMYSKNIYIDQASWTQSSPILKINAKTQTECSTFCTSNVDYCSAFVFGPDGTCQNSMPSSLIEFTSQSPAIFPRITVWIDAQKVPLKKLTECNAVNGKRCIFPYINGERKNRCFQSGGGLRCATAIDVNNGIMTDSAFADDNCFLDKGAGCKSKYNKPCIFPYIRDGKNVTGCRRSPDNTGSACPLMLYPDGSYIKTWLLFITEEWCSFDCLKYNEN